MSANFKHFNGNPTDVYTASVVTPPSSAVPPAPQESEEEAILSVCTTFDTISQQEVTQRTYAVRGAAMDTITMGHAVRIPHALKSATRRTMLDVLTQLNRETTENEENKRVGDLPTHGRRLPYGGGNAHEHSYPVPIATCMGSAPANVPPAAVSPPSAPPDLTRSLRHLLPSRRGSAAKARQHCKQQQIHAEEDSISEFEDDADHNNNNDSDRTRQIQPQYLINEECERNEQDEQHTFIQTVPVHEEGQRRASHRSWAKLFNCDDLHNDAPQAQDTVYTVQQEQEQQMLKCTPAARASTKSSRRSSSSLCAVWADVDDAPRSSTAGRTSLVTLLDTAEAEDEERRRSFSHVLSVEKTEERMEHEEKESNHLMLLMSSHTFGKPSFAAMGLSTNGSSSSASAVAALLQGATTTSGVVKRGGGRGRMSAAMKQLSCNPTSARVVTYLARSFDDWKLDASVILQFNKKNEEQRVNSTFDDSCTNALLSTRSGVHLKLRVVMVESTYSIYCVRAEIVWADEQTAMELGCSATTTMPSTTSLTAEQEGGSSSLCSVEKSTFWTIVLTAPSFQSTPIVVGEHLYLARPFFSYPAIHIIVASLNITSDAALRLPQPALQGRRRRPREDISSQQQQKQKGQNQKDEETDGPNSMARYEKMPMDTITPERTSRPPVLLSAPSPFSAYDPFLNPPTSLFRNNAADTDPSVTFFQKQRQVGTSLKMASEENNNNDNNKSDSNMSGNSISVSMLQTVRHDIIGDHFPRGPGDEWDVPLELLLPFCPLQGRAASASSAADARNPSPSVVRSWMRSGGGKVSSSVSSLSSVDEYSGVPPALTNQKSLAWRYDDVLLSD